VGKPDDSPVGAIILAAGMSKRMGEPKQLLPLGENMLLEQVLDNVRSAAVDEIVLVLGASADTIQQRISTDKVKVVVNDSYQRGMGTSLAAGLTALSPTIKAALVVLADQPFVGPATLDRIVEQYRHSTAQIVIPLYKGFRGNPVLLDRSVFPEVMALGGDVGCRAIFGAHLDGILKVPVEDIGILLDIDNQEDFERLRNFGSSPGTDQSILELADLGGREARGDISAPPRPHSAAPDISCEDRRPELVIVGQEPVALALAKLGKALNFSITVVAPLLNTADVPEADRILRTMDFSTLPRSSGRYVVVASRGRFDEEAIEQALLADSPYIAVVANKKRGQELVRSLHTRGFTTEQLARVRAPAGIEIGAQTPEEIALSIMAEMVAERRKASFRGRTTEKN
jgi:molybdenum cofactor cytidylyltransferase